MSVRNTRIRALCSRARFRQEVLDGHFAEHSAFTAPLLVPQLDVPPRLDNGLLAQGTRHAAAPTATEPVGDERGMLEEVAEAQAVQGLPQAALDLVGREAVEGTVFGGGQRLQLLIPAAAMISHRL